METAWKKNAAPEHFRTANPVLKGTACAFRDFELHGTIGIALDDRSAFVNPIFQYEIGDFQPNEVAAAQFAVDCEIKQRQVPEIARKFKPSTNGPGLFREQWAPFANQTPLVSRSAI